MQPDVLEQPLTEQQRSTIREAFIRLAAQYSAALAFDGAPRVLLDNSVLDALRSWERGGGRAEQRRAFAEFVHFLSRTPQGRPILAVTPTVLWEYNHKELPNSPERLTSICGEIETLLAPLPCRLDLNEVTDFTVVSEALRQLASDLEQVRVALTSIRSTDFSSALTDAEVGVAPLVLARRLVPAVSVQYLSPDYVHLVLAAIVERELLLNRDLKKRGLRRLSNVHEVPAAVLKTKGTKLLGGGDVDLLSVADSGRQYATGESAPHVLLTIDSRLAAVLHQFASFVDTSPAYAGGTDPKAGAQMITRFLIDAQAKAARHEQRLREFVAQSGAYLRERGLGTSA